MDINTALPLYVRPIFHTDGQRIVGLLEMTSLRGLDGLNSKSDNNKHNSGRNIRDDSVIDNFVKQLSRKIIDMNEREIYIGNSSLFEFDLKNSEKHDPFKAIQAKEIMPTPPSEPLVSSPDEEKSPDNFSEQTISESDS